MKNFKKILKFYQNARKTERKLTDFVHLKCKIGREPHIRLPQTQEKHIKPVGATTMFSKKTCRLAMRSSEMSLSAARLSVAQKRDLQKPSLVREGGRQTELAECRLTDE